MLIVKDFVREVAKRGHRHLWRGSSGTYIGGGRVLLLDRSGLPLIVRGSNYALTGALLSEGIYDRRFIKYLGKVLVKSDVYVDVGANIGLFCLEAAKHLGSQGKIIAFEPNSDCRALLEANISMRVDLGHVTCSVDLRGQALSSSSGTAELAIPVNHDGRATLKVGSVWTSSQRTRVEKVEVTTLDEALADIPSVKLLKIDVEGSELNVLRGARATISDGRISLLDMEYIPALAGHDMRAIGEVVQEWATTGASVGVISRLGSYRPLSRAQLRRELPSAAHLIVDFRRVDQRLTCSSLS